MAVLDSYTQTGNREDLIDVVTRVAVEETPFMSSLKKTKATGTLHEWMTETLDSPADNAQIEGSDASYGTLSTRTRLGNYCQTVRKTGQISDTQEAIMKAGVVSEYRHQLEKATKELARDMERVCIQGTKAAGATGATARRAGGFFYWTTTNRRAMGTTITGTAQAGGASTITLAVGAGASTSDGDQILLTGGTGAGQYRVQTGAAAGDVITVTEAWDVVPDATTTYIVYTAPAALTESTVNDAIQDAYDAGGKVDTLFVAGKQKRAISGFATSLRQFVDDQKQYTNVVDIMQTDFGPVKVKYDRWVPTGAVMAVDSSMWALANLRPIKAQEMPKSGSSRKFMIESEFTLESLGENANAMVGGAL